MSQEIESSEKEKVKSLDWISISEEAKENLDLFPHSLTNIELYIITGLYGEGAITTRGVWKRVVFKEFQFELWPYQEITKEDKKGFLEKIKDSISKSKTLKLDRFMSFSSKIKIIPFTEKNLFEFVKDVLKFQRLSVPTYEKTLNNLEALEENNFVMKRMGKNVNAKYLWSINPKFLKIYKNRRKEVQKECAQILKSGADLDTEFDIRTLHFYNIPPSQKHNK